MRLGLVLLGVVVALGTCGYLLFGFTLVQALYQTVTTVTTVGFEEVRDFGTAEQLYTMALVVVGVGTALYTLGVLVEALVEGRVAELLGRRRMEHRISALSGHVIVCGGGRVGTTIAAYLRGGGHEVVVVEREHTRAVHIPGLVVEGDASDDNVLRAAGIERARALVTAINTDADNLYVTLTGRSLRRDLFIVARARVEGAEAKLFQAGADRVVNPQRIGGARMAAFTMQPHVAEFLDVVMHDGSLEFRLAEVAVPAGSPLEGLSIRDAHIRDQTGALVLALRHGDGRFTTNPPPDTVIDAGQVLIVIGTQAQLDALGGAVRMTSAGIDGTLPGP